ncbi:MAG TPA: ABC transporter permease [Thermoanaerobaculia bacterium]
MIRHLLKLVWNRRKTNALIIAEIFLAFLVVFAVMCTAVTMTNRWAYGTLDPRSTGDRSLGFDWHDVYVASVEAPRELMDSPEAGKELRATSARLLEGVQQTPGVVAASAAITPPYGFSTIEDTFSAEERRGIGVLNDAVSDDYAKVMQIRILRGRWFGREDDAATYVPAVLDTNAARGIFGDADPLGQTFRGGSDRKLVYRVVGIIAPFRLHGEMAEAQPMLFHRATRDAMVENVVLRVPPGTPPAFEAALAARLQAIGPQLSFRIRRMDDMRRNALRFSMTPVVAGAVVCFFLITMVGLGLTGVLWQDVTKRTREIGLRRATGASSRAVLFQVIGEVLLLTTIAVLAASILIAQLPILGAFTLMSRQAYSAGIIAALASIYALTLLCALYPSWLASRLRPAEALRYE